MATQTTNYGLTKPAGTDNALIGDINGNMDIIDSELDKLSACFAAVQHTDTATVAIAEGAYVVWKGVLCTASAAIAIGDTLSDLNLTEVEGGGLNQLIWGYKPTIREVEWAYTSLASNSTRSTNLKTLIDADMPVGATFAGIAGYRNTSANVVFRNIAYANETNSLSIRNLGSTAASGTVYIRYIAG